MKNKAVKTKGKEHNHRAGYSAKLDTLLFLSLVVSVLLSSYYRGLFFHFERYSFHGVFLGISLVILIFRIYSDSYEELQLNRSNMVLLAFTLLFGLTVPFAADKGLALHEFMSYAVCFLVYLSIGLVMNRKNVTVLLHLFAINSVLLIVLGLASYFRVIPADIRPLGMSMQSLYSGRRLFTHLQYPNTAAAYFIMFYLGALALLPGVKKLSRQILLSGTTCLLFWGVYLTGSRGGYVTFLVAIGLMLVVHRRNYFWSCLIPPLYSLGLWLVMNPLLERYFRGRESGQYFLLITGICLLHGVLVSGSLLWIKKIDWARYQKIRVGLPVVIAVALILIGWFGYGDVLIESTTSTLQRFSFQERSVQARFLYYQDAGKMIAERPVLGWGGRGWEALFVGFRSSQYWSTTTHNYFVQVMIDTGLVGIVLLVYFIGLLIRNGMKVSSKLEAEDGLFLKTLVVMVFIGFFHSVIDFNFSLGTYHVTLWMLAGVINNYYEKKTIEKKSEK